MKAPIQWGAKRFKPMVMLAQVAALNVPTCYEASRQTRSHQLLALPEARGVETIDWQRMYREPRCMENAVLLFLFAPESVSGLDENHATWRDDRSHLSLELQARVQDQLARGKSPKQLKRSQLWLDAYYTRMHLPQLRRLLIDDEPAPPGFAAWLG